MAEDESMFYRERGTSSGPSTKQIIKYVILGVGGLTALIGINSATYTVDESEQAVITQFGKPKKIILNPIDGVLTEEESKKLKELYSAEGIKVSYGAGLKFKKPFIQKVQKFDRRLLRWNGYPEEVPTRDKKYIWVDPTARWYIKDPLKFLRSVGTEDQAQARLDDVIDSTSRNSITERNLIEIVRTDNREMMVAEDELRESLNIGEVKEGRPKIVYEMTVNSRKAMGDFGIDIHEHGVLLKGLTYVDSVKVKVEDRMKAERTRIAKKYISEGDGEYNNIIGQREKDVKEILSGAYKEAELIEGKADAEALEIYAKSYSKDPELYRFLETLKLYEESFASHTTIILGSDNPLMKYFEGNLKK
ncbi:protease modulator HflC [Nanoarchaeota archaeon]